MKLPVLLAIGGFFCSLNLAATLSEQQRSPHSEPPVPETLYSDDDLPEPLVAAEV